VKKNSLNTIQETKFSNQSTLLISKLGFYYIANSLYLDSLLESRIGEEGYF